MSRVMFSEIPILKPMFNDFYFSCRFDFRHDNGSGLASNICVTCISSISLTALIFFIFFSSLIILLINIITFTPFRIQLFRMLALRGICTLLSGKGVLSIYFAGVLNG